MQKFTIREEDFVELPEILKRVRYCLRNQVGFSLVRVGDAENQVLAQGLFIPTKKSKTSGGLKMKTGQG